MPGLYNLKGVDDIGAMEPYVPALYVDTVNGKLGNTGASWAEAFATMAAALSAVQTGGTIYFIGDVREELTGSNLKFDVKIVGAGSLHHADVPATGYHPGASAWRPPASPTSTTPLLKVRGRGWKFENIMFDCPVDSAAIYLERNALATTAEYDPSHVTFKNCLFRNGKYAIQDVGGAHNVVIEGCEFFALSEASGCAIINTSSSVAAPLKWRIEHCFFPGNGAAGGNESHIDAPLTGSFILNSYFGTVEGTGLYIDLTGGDDNTVSGNVLAGDYTTADYVAGTNDIWYGNRCAVTATTAPDGVSLVVPAGP